MSTITDNMGITNPTPSETAGPDWAEQIETAIVTIDAHDHSSGKGVKITPTGLNINADLEFNSNDATELRSSRYDNQTSVLSGGSDVRCVYVKSNNLYYNNGSGTSVRITNGASLDSSSVAQTFSALNVSSNITILAADTYTLYRVDTAATRTIQLPAANAVADGRYYYFYDETGTSETYPITVQKAGADTINGVAANKDLQGKRGCWIFVSDGSSDWNVVSLHGESIALGADGYLKTNSGQLNIQGASGMVIKTATGNITIYGDSVSFLPQSNFTVDSTYFYLGTDNLAFSGSGNVVLNHDGYTTISGTNLTFNGSGTVSITGDASSTIDLGTLSLADDLITINTNTTISDTTMKFGSGASTDTGAVLRVANNTTAVSARNAGASANISLLALDSSDNISIGSTTTDNLLNGSQKWETKTTADTTYTLDTTTNDTVVMCSHTSGCTITLPSVIDQRVIVIKDIGGNAHTNPHTITSASNINGSSSDAKLWSSYGAIWIVGDSSTGWQIL